MSGVCAGDVHRLGELRDLQRKVDRLRLRDVDLDGLLRNRREALQLGGDVVDADRERRQAIDAFSIADFRSREAGRCCSSR